MKTATATLALLLASVQPAVGVAQAPAANANHSTKTYRLTSVSMTTLAVGASYPESTEIVTTLRNLVPVDTKILLTPNQNAITVEGSPEAQATVQSVLHDLDRPRQQYRLIYTFTESDGGKPVGLQRYSMVLASGQRMQMKQGSRVPIVVGAKGSSGAMEQQTTFIDVGLNFDSTVQEYGTGFQLKSKVERTALAEDATSQIAGMPVIRQSLLEGVALLVPGKPSSLGSIDLPGSTRHLEVEATVEPVK